MPQCGHLDVRYLIRSEQRGHLNAFGARFIAHAAKIKIAPAENRIRLTPSCRVAEPAKIIKTPTTTKAHGTKRGIVCTSSSYYVSGHEKSSRVGLQLENHRQRWCWAKYERHSGQDFIMGFATCPLSRHLAGNERNAILRDDTDQQKFLDLVGRSVGQFDLCLHGYGWDCTVHLDISTGPHASF